MDYRSWHSLFTITALWLLGQCLCYGPISQNSVTFASPPSQNDGLKFLGGANDYGLASPPTSSSVVTSGSVVPRHYWWQQEPNPFVSGDCASGSCQPAVVLHVSSSLQPKLSTGITPTAATSYTGILNISPHPGCAAALKCVPDNYCTVEGTASDSPVVLTKEVLELRVPLTDCQDPVSGNIGKCCRDVNYKDPWLSENQEHKDTHTNVISTDDTSNGLTNGYFGPVSSIYISQPASTETARPISAFKLSTNVPKPVGDYGSEDSNSVSPYPDNSNTIPSYGVKPQPPSSIGPTSPPYSPPYPSTLPTPPNYPPQSLNPSHPPFSSESSYSPQANYPSRPPQPPQGPNYVTQSTYPIPSNNQSTHPIQSTYPSQTTIITHPQTTYYPLRPIYTYYPPTYPSYGPPPTSSVPSHQPPQSPSYPVSQKPSYPSQNYPSGTYPQQSNRPEQQPYPASPAQPGYPGEPSYPLSTESPKQPNNIGQQLYPSTSFPPQQPSNPGQATYPSSPEPPKQPGYPAQQPYPSNPGQATYPSSPEPPKQPGYPAQQPYPSIPQQPNYPIQSPYPSSSEPSKQPGYPEKPPNPLSPTLPLQPGYPGQQFYPPSLPPLQPSYPIEQPHPSAPASPSHPGHPTSSLPTPPTQAFPTPTVPSKQPGYPNSIQSQTEKPYSPPSLPPKQPGYPPQESITEKPNPVSTVPSTYPSQPPQIEIANTTPAIPFPAYPSIGVSQTEHPHPVSSPPSSGPGYPVSGSQQPAYPSSGNQPPNYPILGNPQSGIPPTQQPSIPPQLPQPGTPSSQQPNIPSLGSPQPGYPQQPSGFPASEPGNPSLGQQPTYPESSQKPSGYPGTGQYPNLGPGQSPTNPGSSSQQPTYPNLMGPGQLPIYPGSGNQQPGYPGPTPGYPPGNAQPGYPILGSQQPGYPGTGQYPNLGPGQSPTNPGSSGQQPTYPNLMGPGQLPIYPGSGNQQPGYPGPTPGYPPGNAQPGYPILGGQQPGHPGTGQHFGYPFTGQPGYPFPGPSYFYPYPGQPGVRLFVSEATGSTPIPPNSAIYPLSPQQGAIVPNSQRPHVSIDPGVTPSLLLKEFTGLCGKKSHDGTPHGEAPWHAIVYSSKNKDLICGGAIVSENAILTTAHCLDHSESESTQAKVGPEGKVHHVQAIVRHSKYDRNTYNRDLALVILKEPIEFDSHLGKICLPTSVSQMESLDRECYVSTLTKELDPKTLKSVPVQVFSYKDCESKLKNTYLGKYFVLNDSFSCGSTPTNDELCTVKVGSPIACNNGNGSYELFGLKSWDLGCQEYKKSAIFSNFDVFWVRSMLGMPTSKLVANEQAYLRAKFRGETLEGVKIEQKPGFNQGYGR